MNRDDVVSVLLAARHGPHDHVKPDLIRGWNYERLSAVIEYCLEKRLVRAISVGHLGSPHPEYILQGITASGEDYLDSQELSSAPVVHASRNAGNIFAIVGFILALLALGLPMIGVTVNLYLGAIALLLAFALMVYGFWIWERSLKWHGLLRLLTVGVAALIYFSLVGHQIQVEYRKERERPKALVAKPATQAAVLPAKAPPHPRESRKPTPPSARAFASPAPGAAPLTQNCPGGICVGGDNNGTAIVNNYEPSQRTLSSEQRSRLIAALKAAGTFTVAVRHSQGSLEAQNYADEIQSALVEAGWIIRQPQFLIQEKEAIGNWVLVPDREHPTDGASALLASLQSAAIEAQGIEVTGLHASTFDLVIGLPKKPISP